MPLKVGKTGINFSQREVDCLREAQEVCRWLAENIEPSQFSIRALVYQISLAEISEKIGAVSVPFFGYSPGEQN